MSATNVYSSLAPKQLSLWRRFYAGWMKFARFLGYVNTIIILTVFYFLVVGPIALFLKLIGRDLLDRKAERRDSYWYDKTAVEHSIESTQHLF